MSTTHYEYHINIDGRTMTPPQLFEFARGLVEAEAVSHEAEPAPDTWEIEEPMRFQSFAHMPLNDRGQAACITVLAYHLWQLEERITGGDGSHKSCDPIRIEWDGNKYITSSYVFPDIDEHAFDNLQQIERKMTRMFEDFVLTLLENGRKREGVKW